jgi:hypothetical protein
VALPFLLQFDAELPESALYLTPAHAALGNGDREAHTDCRPA